MDSATAKKIKSKNTVIEKTLSSALFKKGLRFRRNDPNVFGKPDIVFKRRKVAVFCDSEFWHGKKYLNGQKFVKNKDFWENKIKRNIGRDEEVGLKLKNEGWSVIRFWGSEIKKNLDGCVDKVVRLLKV